jgi:hypothetical protein
MVISSCILARARLCDRVVYAIPEVVDRGRDLVLVVFSESGTFTYDRTGVLLRSELIIPW